MPPRSQEALKSYNIMDPLLREAVAENPRFPPQPDIVSTRTARNGYLDRLRAFTPIPGPVPGVSEEDHRIRVRDGAEITVRVYTPEKEPEGGSPLICMFHEGGWCFGNMDDEALNCRMFCRDLKAVCVNVDYR